MRFAKLVAFVFAVSAWQIDAVGQNSPPPSQSFGPDTYRIGVFIGRGTPTGLTCAPVAGGRECNGFLASIVDRARLDVKLMIPSGDGPHPVVAVLHGWGGSKGSLGYIADPLFASGLAVLRYSARGFGDSWGQVNLADIHVEIEDLKSIIGQVVADPQFQLDHRSVGIVGVSYGGGQTWLSLLDPEFPMPGGGNVLVRAVVPIVPWTDLVYSLLPNGRPEFSLRPKGSAKLSFINGLFISGFRFTPQRPYFNYPDYLMLWHAWLNAVEPNNIDPVYRRLYDGTAGYRSIWWQQDFWNNAATNRVPIFQIQGLTDDLFPLTEAKRMLLTLKTLDPAYPIASYFGDLGHPRAANKPAERDCIVELTTKWFMYYLKRAGSEPAHVVHAAITRPRGEPFDPEDVLTVPTYGDLHTGILSQEFDGQATLINPASNPSAVFWDPLALEAANELEPNLAPPQDSVIVPGSLAVYTVPVAALSGGSSLLIAGQPTVSLRARVSTVPRRVQLNVRLFELASDGTKQLITRGTFILERASDDITIPTYGNVWEAGADKVLQLEISNVDAPYLAPSRVPSVTEISRVRLDLPVRTEPAPSSICRPSAPSS